jgi:iron complex outermembrane recepter protein
VLWGAGLKDQRPAEIKPLNLIWIIPAEEKMRNKLMSWMRCGAFLLLVIFSSLNASLFIEGEVYDRRSGEPIGGAEIFQAQQQEGSFTNDNGYFRFNYLGEKSDTLTIRAIGYQEIQLPARELSKGTIIKLSPQAIDFEAISITALRGDKGKSPITYSSISREELKSRDINRDVPSLLSWLPSATYYSENGNGIGYSYLTIRGFDQRRVSVMINGIPQNDPEDHNVYWINFHDLLHSVEDVQVQRGAGSAFYGPAAIGGSINLVTKYFSLKPEYRFQSTFGSYNTRSLAGEMNSGLVADHWNFRLRLSAIESDGYREGSWSKYQRWFAAAGYFRPNFNLKLITYGGPQEDGLAFYGIPKEFNGDSKLRRSNWSAASNDFEWFHQPHYELHSSWHLSDRLSIDQSLLYITGDGYFDYDGSWAPPSYYRLTESIDSQKLLEKYNPSDYPYTDAAMSWGTMIRAWVSNRQWGWLPRVNFSYDKLSMTAGLELRQHKSLHWGRLQSGQLLLFGESDTVSQSIPTGENSIPYYEYKGAKNILSAYLHSRYQLSDRLTLMAELQMAKKTYQLYDEAYIQTDFSLPFAFINPRLGMTYAISEMNSLYANLSQTSREPRLKNYYDAAEATTPPDWGAVTPNFEMDLLTGEYDFSKPNVHPEMLKNFEIGFLRASKKLQMSVNYYYMDFQNEIVSNGALDRFGYPVTGNAERTLHQGLEFSFLYQRPKAYLIGMNGAISTNEFIRHSIYEYNADWELVELRLDGNKISGFPEKLFNMWLELYLPGQFLMRTEMKYSGEFFTSNTEDAAEQIEAYTFINMQFRKIIPIYGQSVNLAFYVNNVLDDKILLHGIGSDYFPLASRNYLISLEIKGLLSK